MTTMKRKHEYLYCVKLGTVRQVEPSYRVQNPDEECLVLASNEHEAHKLASDYDFGRIGYTNRVYPPDGGEVISVIANG